MRVHFAVQDPGRIVFKMKLTMCLDEWERLQEQLREINADLFTPAGQLSSKITNMTVKAQNYWFEHDEEVE